LALNYRIWRDGGRIYQRGDVHSLYIAPATFRALFGKHLRNGWWNISAAILERGCIGLKHALPAVGLVVALALLMLWPAIGATFIVVLLSADVVRALLIAGDVDRTRLAWAFVVAQTGHAIGQVAGVIALPGLVWWHALPSRRVAVDSEEVAAALGTWSAAK
jgi:hypothetical protein